MKATLTIEVPDDFKKGQCWRCRLSQVDFDYDCLSCKVDKWVMHDAYDSYDCDPYQADMIFEEAERVISRNCPLEIQEKPTSCVGICRDCMNRFTCDKDLPPMTLVCTKWIGE